MVSTQLGLTPNIVKIKCRAELLAVEFLLSDKTKLIISTCYIVGTLGRKNFEELSKAIKTLIHMRSQKIYTNRRLNFPQMNWDTQSSNISLEQDFLNMFAENSLMQTVHTPSLLCYRALKSK